MNTDRLTLADIPSSQECVIVKVHGHGGFRHRIMELGFIKGERVKVVKNAPLMDPVEYEVLGSHISLRRSEAQNIDVVSLDKRQHSDAKDFNGTIEEHIAKEVEEIGNQITVALVGNPNCGKTSFFNNVTGSKEKVGNYSGVTVSSKIATFYHKGFTINMVDLPGTYSMAEFTPEELYVRDYIINEQPDVVLNIVDAGNLERNMYLTTQLIDINPRMVMALNMYDEFVRVGNSLDYDSLSKMLGFPIVPVIANTGFGIGDVLEQIISVYTEDQENTKHIHINYGELVENAIREIRSLVDINSDICNRYHMRYISLGLLQGDSIIENIVSASPNYGQISKLCIKWRERLEKEYKDDIVTIVSNIKYGFIKGALSETFTPGDSKTKDLSYALDTILTHKFLGIPALILFMSLMFEATFKLGSYPQDWLERGVEAISGWVSSLIQPGILRDLLVDGVISGVGGVLVFLPNILILFMFISFLEDSGYMARAAFIMDKVMHKAGLHGKSFIPYIIGFGCSVPAIMATRTLESRSDRILTALTIPFISCSARLPVYLLFVAAFFNKYQGLVLMSLYFIGILMAIVTSLLLKRVRFKDQSDQFVMELPPYRFPTFKNIIIHMWDKSAMYIKKMGTVILAASIIIWALGYFPINDGEVSEQERMENSYIGKIGHAVEPIVAPLGFDWKMGVSLVTGLPAKEVVVSSLAVLYGAEDDGVDLSEALVSAKDEEGASIFTPLKAFVFMLFILLYFPCIASISAIQKELNWRWALFSVFYTTSVAWIISFIVYQIGLLL